MNYIYLHSPSLRHEERAHEAYRRTREEIETHNGVDKDGNPNEVFIYSLEQLEQDHIGRAELAGRVAAFNTYCEEFTALGEDFPYADDAMRMGRAMRRLAEGQPIGRHSAFAPEEPQRPYRVTRIMSKLRRSKEPS